MGTEYSSSGSNNANHSYQISQNKASYIMLKDDFGKLKGINMNTRVKDFILFIN